jgi:tryptophan halogenase
MCKNMNSRINRVVVVGGGTAGWLSAGIIAAEHYCENNSFELVLIESPNIPTIGVGEGTWPSMRSTLQKMGILETDFFRKCDASFKQGTQFYDWTHGKGETYLHPFTAPQEFNDKNLALHWHKISHKIPFADAVCPQAKIIYNKQAPKNISTPEYAFNVNYGYHLDAAKFAELLRQHCVNKLGVKHVKADMVAINSHKNGDIKSITIDTNDEVAGDLFIDCTGSRALLIGDHYKIKLESKRQYLFNNSALAAQVGYVNDWDPIESCTLSTAQSVGWIWDIGLPTRRGIGHVYSDDHTSDDAATTKLLRYIQKNLGDEAADKASVRKLSFDPGHREKFWHKNCVAIGMSAGFIEPLEASALVLVELSAAMIAEQFPANRKIMDIVAKRFNEKFIYRWDRIIDFIKLHYILSKRTDSEYWKDNRLLSSVPDSLKELIELWRFQVPWHRDNYHIDEMFPSASFQYVLYGMDFKTEVPSILNKTDRKVETDANSIFENNAIYSNKLSASLPTNRELINKICNYGLQKI